MPSRRHVRASAGLLLASAVIATGGCGSSTSSRDRYVDDLNAAQRQFAGAVAQMPGALAPGRVSNADPSATRAAATSYGRSLQAVIARLRGIRPPDDVAALHRQLIDQLSTYGGAVQAAIPSLAAADRSTRLSARARLLRSVQVAGAKITGTLDDIDARLHV